MKTAESNKLLVRLADGREIMMHPDEIERRSLRLNLTGIEELPRHPVFEIAEQTPVFLVGEKAYSLGDGEVSDTDNTYVQKKSFFGEEISPLVEIGDFDSLDSLLLDRASSGMKKIGENLAKEMMTDLVSFHSVSDNLDAPQLIFKLVFPYLHDGRYRDKVSALLGENRVGEGAERPPSLAKKIAVTSSLEKIADEVEIEVRELIEEIEQEDEYQDRPERTFSQEKLDSLLGYQAPKPYSGNSFLGKVLKGKNVAIVEGLLYLLVPRAEGNKQQVRIDGKEFSLVEVPGAKEKSKETFEVGDLIRMNADASKNYKYTKEGSEGEIRKILPSGMYHVFFTKQTGNLEREAQTFEVGKDYMEHLQDNAGIFPAFPGDLESRFLSELGKKIGVDALKEHFSRKKVIDLLRTQDAEILEMAGRGEYKGDGFGFVMSGDDYWVYLEVPPFAIKSQFDDNYYFFDKSRIATEVLKHGDGLKYEGNLVLIDDNNHPFLHNARHNFAKICIGGQDFPTSGKDTGDVIAKRLRRGIEVLMFGYTSYEYNHKYKLEDDKVNNFFSKNKRDLGWLNERNIPIIQGGER